MIWIINELQIGNLFSSIKRKSQVLQGATAETKPSDKWQEKKPKLEKPNAIKELDLDFIIITEKIIAPASA